MLGSQQNYLAVYVMPDGTRVPSETIIPTCLMGTIGKTYRDAARSEGAEIRFIPIAFDMAAFVDGDDLACLEAVATVQIRRSPFKVVG